MSQIDDFLDGNSSAQQTKSQIDSFLDAAPPAQGGAISDLGKSLKVGVQKLPGMVTGLADLPIAHCPLPIAHCPLPIALATGHWRAPIHQSC